MTAQLIVITGPTTSGKSMVVNELLLRHNDWSTVYSYTTRAPRINEDDRKRYYYVTEKEFKGLVASGEIIEHQEYAGNLYGTSRQSLASALVKSPVVLFDLQTVGFKALRQLYPHTVGIYLQVSVADARLRMAADQRRADISETEKERRFALIAKLNAQSAIYDHVVKSRQGKMAATVDAVEAVINRVIQ